MANPIISLAADGGDIRMGAAKNEMRNDSIAMGAPGLGIRPQHRLLHDPAVTFEEYHYYALKTRAEEDSLAASDRGMLQDALSHLGANHPQARLRSARSFSHPRLVSPWNTRRVTAPPMASRKRCTPKSISREKMLAWRSLIPSGQTPIAHLELLLGQLAFT